MTTSKFLSKHCKPCEGGVPPFTAEQTKEALTQIHDDWRVVELWIERGFILKSFKEALHFVNRVGELAEEEGHHPDIVIQFNKVTLKLWTHAIGGLSENDFILASKIDNLKS